MIKTTITLLLCSIFPICIHAQLTWLNPLPSGNQLNKITFINDSTGFIIDDIGNLYKTVDQGTNWLQVTRLTVDPGYEIGIFS